MGGGVSRRASKRCVCSGRSDDQTVRMGVCDLLGWRGFCAHRTGHSQLAGSSLTVRHNTAGDHHAGGFRLHEVQPQAAKRLQQPRSQMAARSRSLISKLFPESKANPRQSERFTTHEASSKGRASVRRLTQGTRGQPPFYGMGHQVGVIESKINIFITSTLTPTLLQQVNACSDELKRAKSSSNTVRERLIIY